MRCLPPLFLFFTMAAVLQAQNTTEFFSNGSNEAGWEFQVNAPDILETTGGFGGGWLHNPLADTGIPVVATTITPSCYTGDFRALNVSAIQVSAITVSNQFGTMGIPMTLVLKDTKGTTDPLDDDFAYRIGSEIPQAGAGWNNEFFVIPSDDTAPTPLGWSGGWASNDFAFRPGVDWNDVITNVDRVEIWWGSPGQPAFTQIWDVGLDNPRIFVATAVTPRNGSGINPMALTTTDDPLLGGVWSVDVDLAMLGTSASFLAVSAQRTSGAIFNGLLIGEVLLLPPLFVEEISLTGSYSLFIPPDCALLNGSYTVQAAGLASGVVRLTNALDFTLGSF